MQHAFREMEKRWRSIVAALEASGIEPDLVTFVALCNGVDVLAQNLGIQPKRTIGFVPSREQR